ncbi:MAG: NAD-dependent epimerase/dehydratase family protein [Candidatus Heimdallarchaeota archaeon]|nr:MAG: NAD-dependent epimerase/dehydratase family protein [Candidatus Heimdallarchaeota archaeon]
MTRVIAITGAAGYLGQHLIQYLNRVCSDIELFVAIDIQKIAYFPEIPLISYKIDVRDNFFSVLEDHGVTDLIHMAWILNPIHNVKKAYKIDVEGTKNVLKEGSKANVDYFLHTSSTLAYGAHPDNPYPLSESDPLRGNQKFHYSHHKVLAEQVVDEFRTKNNNNMKIGKIRPSAILSYDSENFVANILRGGWRTFFLMPYPNEDTPIQFLHLKDALEGFRFMLDQRLEGVYNVCPNTDVLVGQIPRILNGRGVKVPLRLLKGLLWIQWKLRLSQAPPAYLDFVAYPFVASNQKVKNLGYSPKYSTEEVLLSFKGK